MCWADNTRVPPQTRPGPIGNHEVAFVREYVSRETLGVVALPRGGLHYVSRETFRKVAFSSESLNRGGIGALPRLSSPTLEMRRHGASGPSPLNPSALNPRGSSDLSPSHREAPKRPGRPRFGGIEPRTQLSPPVDQKSGRSQGQRPRHTRATEQLPRLEQLRPFRQEYRAIPAPPPGNYCVFPSNPGTPQCTASDPVEQGPVGPHHYPNPERIVGERYESPPNRARILRHEGSEARAVEDLKNPALSILRERGATNQ